MCFHGKPKDGESCQTAEQIKSKELDNCANCQKCRQKAKQNQSCQDIQSEDANIKVTMATMPNKYHVSHLELIPANYYGIVAKEADSDSIFSLHILVSGI